MSNQSPFNQRVVARDVQGVPKGLGDGMETHLCAIKRPMPCIVILVHGVNDVGEAYQNQEAGIIRGLHERMSRNDMYPHVWKNFKLVQGEEPQQCINKIGRSPVIPFYWGYKPVDYETYAADQERYRQEIARLGADATLPYNAYQENDPTKLAKLGNDGKSKLKFCNDNFGNVLDDCYAKGGGTFANATTNIPDMLGPGADGLALAAAGHASLYMNGGDYTHPIYDNPHRIYQFFAAQRLADLILTIRKNPATEKDVINIVAHSQGTIITMLANMLVYQAGRKPADCVILNHSPYALEGTTVENMTPGHHQTDEARQQTFINFCNLMKTNPNYGQVQHTPDEIKEMVRTITLPVKNKWSDNPLYSRNNAGLVYNYFCPNDGTVSLLNIQGFGWRGIPENIAGGLANLRQRVFCENNPSKVGDKPTTEPFIMPQNKGGFKYSALTNASYTFEDVIINGAELPEKFEHLLQGTGAAYKYTVDPDSPDQTISYSAKANALSRTEKVRATTFFVKKGNMNKGHNLTEDELALYSADSPYSRGRKEKYIRGVVGGFSHSADYVELVREKTREELEEEWQKADPVGYSQHSSIVMSKDAPEKTMAYDLAIGRCIAFDYQYGEFWRKLLQRADWRFSNNPFDQTRNYYKTGKLNYDSTKKHMNKPDDVLPAGEYGVVNEFYNSKTVIPGRYPEIYNKEVPNLQWDMPEPISGLSTVKKENF